MLNKHIWKIQADEGVPPFIHVGETTRTEVLETLGEPLVHRIVADKETLIYNHERVITFFSMELMKGMSWFFV